MSLRPLLRTKSTAAGATTGSAADSNKASTYPVTVSPDGTRLCVTTGPRRLSCYRLQPDRCLTESSPLFTVALEEEEAPGLVPKVPVAITAIQWVSSEHLAVGLSTGLLRLYGAEGGEVAALRFHGHALTSIHTFPSQPLSQYEADIWLLFQDKVAISVPIFCLVSASDSDNEEPITFVKYRLSAADQVTDLAVFGRQSRLLETPRRDQCFLVSCGRNPTLSFHSLGSEPGYRGLGELVTAVRRRLTKAVVGTVSYLLPSWGYLYRGGGGGASQAPTDPYLPPSKPAASQELEADLSVKDARRVATSVVVDPSERLAAVADALGRVLVVDLWTRSIIRMWKGHRGGQVRS